MTRVTPFGVSRSDQPASRGMLVAALALCALAGSRAGAEPQPSGRECRSIGGSVSTNLGVVDANTTLGTATGDLAGAVTATILEVAPGPDNTTVFTVQHHFVTERGDAVFVDKARATAVMVAPGLYAVLSYPVRITGGTGQFKGATGRIENIGEVDLNRGLTIFRYTGQVCR